MARLIRPSEIVEEWHPLDGVPPPDEIPEAWTAAHVGRRLAEGFTTLRHMPMSLGPREFGRAWPEYRVEWEDLLAQEDGLGEAARLRERVQNRIRVKPSAEDVQRMERAIVWPARYVQHEGHRDAVQKAALAISINRDVEWIVRRFGGFIDTWIDWDRLGREAIAEGLNADDVKVF